MAETCKLCNAERGPLHSHPDAATLARKLIEAVEAVNVGHFGNAKIDEALRNMRDICKKLGVDVDG